MPATRRSTNKQYHRQNMELKPGDKAPDFTTTDQDGRKVKLSSLRGKKVVLYFYPRNMTPGCTAEACNLRDNYRALTRAGYEVLGISTDSEQSHQKFIAKERPPFGSCRIPTKPFTTCMGPGWRRSCTAENTWGQP